MHLLVTCMPSTQGETCLHFVTGVFPSTSQGGCGLGRTGGFLKVIQPGCVRAGNLSSTLPDLKSCEIKERQE